MLFVNTHRKSEQSESRKIRNRMCRKKYTRRRQHHCRNLEIECIQELLNRVNAVHEK